MTTETLNHTPLPWHFDELDRKPDGCGYIRTDADSLEISHHGDMGRSREVNLANAAFIIQAVNSHDELLAALKHAQEAMAWHGGCDFETEDGKRAEDVIANAIAKAEGRVN